MEITAKTTMKLVKRDSGEIIPIFGDGANLSKSGEVWEYTGEMEGEGRVQYVSLYRWGGRYGDSIFMEKFVGRIGDKKGAFVFEGSAQFEEGWNGVSKKVIAYSGTGDLENITGEMIYSYSSGEDATAEFKYSLGN